MKIQFIRRLKPALHPIWAYEYIVKGLSSAQIGVRYGVSPQAVSINLRKQNVPMRPSCGHRTHSEKTRDYWVELLHQGLHPHQICNTPGVKVHPATLYKEFRDRGLKIPKENTPSQIKTRIIGKKAFRMRYEGTTWKKIGEALGVPEKRAYLAAKNYAIYEGFNWPLNPRKSE